MKHDESQRRVENLEPGQTITTSLGDSVVLAVGPVLDADASSYAGRWIIHYTPNRTIDPFVIHLAAYDDDSNWWCLYNGSYHKDVVEAVDAFQNYI